MFVQLVLIYQNMVCTYIVRYELALHMCNFPVIFVFSTADLTENAQSYGEIYSISLPVCMVATAVKQYASTVVEFLDRI